MRRLCAEGTSSVTLSSAGRASEGLMRASIQPAAAVWKSKVTEDSASGASTMRRAPAGEPPSAMATCTARGSSA